MDDRLLFQTNKKIRIKFPKEKLRMVSKGSGTELVRGWCKKFRDGRTNVYHEEVTQDLL